MTLQNFKCKSLEIKSSKKRKHHAHTTEPIDLKFGTTLILTRGIFLGDLGPLVPIY